MCDTLVALGPPGDGRTLFAKNSDRPVGEAQVVEAFPRRRAGGTLRTQYLEIDDAGAFALLGSRPEWLWGVEHGVNEHGVAIGNEKVWTKDNPKEAPDALIGMDLVRLGLERGATAPEALEVMTRLLDAHGQGGAAEPSGEPYYSSFLVADPTSAWILETSGRQSAAQRVDRGAAISNRISLPEFESHRLPGAPTGHADVRLAVTAKAVAGGAASLTPADLAGILRDHGGEPFPGPEADPVTGAGVTVCMHVRGYQVTAASMICELPAAPEAPVRAWVALGSPCVSVYVPAVLPARVPPELAKPDTWRRFDALRARVETEPGELSRVRDALDPVEQEFWAAGEGSWPVLDAALSELGA